MTGTMTYAKNTIIMTCPNDWQDNQIESACEDANYRLREALMDLCAIWNDAEKQSGVSIELESIL